MPTGLTLNATTGQVTGTPSAAGTYNVTIYVNDGLVTVSRSFTWTITQPAADTTAPALSITSHTNGQTVSSASATISGTATDSGRGGNGVASVTVNGQGATGGSATGSATASWSRALTLSPGANTITVAADGDAVIASRAFTGRISPDAGFTANETARSLGVTFENLNLDYPTAVKRSRQVSDRLVKGVGFLMKKNDIDVHNGTAKVTAKDTVQVTDADGKTTDLKTKNIVVATGASVAVPPGWTIDGEKIVTYLEAILQEKLPNKAKLGLYFNPFGKVVELIDDCIACGCDKLIEQHGGMAWDEAGFEALKEYVRAELNDAVVEVAKQVEAVLTLSHEIKKRLKGKMQLDTAFAMSDIQLQLDKLIHKGFVTETGWQRLMRALAGAGNRAEAVRAYGQCKKLLADELGIAPSRETEAILNELRARA